MSQNFCVDSILRAIQSVSGSARLDKPTSLHEPYFGGTEAKNYVMDCLDTGWVSTVGQWVSRFENDLAAATGAAHAVVVTNGTVALRLALHLVGVRQCDEVIIPPLTFIATANAVSHLGATPHFVDVDPRTLGMSADALCSRLQQIAVKRDGQVFNRDTGRRLAAIVPVHVFGHPADVIALREVADFWGLPLVEDAAEALGSWREGTHCGLFGDVGTLSFNGNKLISTGAGGALLTNDTNLALRARHLSSTAKLPHRWEFEHDAIGWNDRMPNLNAALGVAQLEDLDRRLEAKRMLAQRYAAALESFDTVQMVAEPAGCCSNYWLVSLRLTAEDIDLAGAQRLQLLEKAHSIGLLLRPIWKPLHLLPIYKDCPASPLTETHNIAPRLVNLPSSPQLLEGWTH